MTTIGLESCCHFSQSAEETFWCQRIFFTTMMLELLKEITRQVLTSPIHSTIDSYSPPWTPPSVKKNSCWAAVPSICTISGPPSQDKGSQHQQRLYPSQQCAPAHPLLQLYITQTYSCFSGEKKKGFFFLFLWSWNNAFTQEIMSLIDRFRITTPDNKSIEVKYLILTIQPSLNETQSKSPDPSLASSNQGSRTLQSAHITRFLEKDEENTEDWITLLLPLLLIFLWILGCPVVPLNHRLT